MNMPKARTFTAAAKAVTKRLAKRGMHSLVCAVGALLAVGTLTANATTYTWTQTAGNAQNWEVNGNWSGGAWPTPASGDTVDFSTVNIAANTTLTLQADRTAEIWKFGDTSNGQDWTVNAGNQFILAGTTPTINVVNRTATLNCVLGGSAGFTKTGVGQLTLGASSSSLSGTINIQAGTLYAPHAALGTGGLVFTGNSTFTKVYNTDNNMPASKSVTLNPGVSATISGSSFYYNAYFAGALSGDTTSSLTVGLGANVEFQFNNTANTFEGELYCNGGGTADNGGRVVFKSLADSSKKIKINNSVFRLANGGVAMNFANRQLEILDSARLDNDSTTASVTMTLAKDLIATIGNNAKTLILSGVNTGANTFAGKIANSATGTGAVSVTKDEAGKWILSGNNTYAGATTISAGTLEIGGSGTLGSGTYAANISNAGTLRFNSSANQTLSGVISGAGALIQDGAGTLSLTKPNTYSGNTTVNAGTLSLGNGTSNSSLADASTLTVASGATLDLNYSGSDTVLYLNLSGSAALAGEWGAIGSGAANESDRITGTGRINNLGGDSSMFNIGYWDGGSIDILANGNLASGGTSGTWNTTLMNWDYGTVAHKVWANTTLSSAVFGGTAGTVTLGEAMTVSNLTINTASYIITGSTLNFTVGNINLTQASTIRSAITGSPTMTDGGAGASSTYLDPTSGNMTLGAITRAVDKHLYLQGSAGSVNSIASIAKGHANAKLYVQSGNWTFGGNVYAGEFYMSGGSLVLNGQLSCDYRTIDLSGGTLHYNNTGAIRDNAGSADNLDFRITGGSIDQTSGAAITTSTTNPQMRWNGNWTFIGSNGENSNLYTGNGAIFLNATRQVTVQNAATTLAVGGVIDGAGYGLTKAGAGTLELRGINTYTGATTITNGTLVGVVGGSCSNSAATVGYTGTLGVKVTDTNKQWTCSSVTVSTGTAAKLKFAFTGVPSTTVAPLNITGAVTFTGTPTVEIVAPTIPVGTYPLLVKGDGTALALPLLSSTKGKLAWSGDYKTLNLIVLPPGTMISFF